MAAHAEVRDPIHARREPGRIPAIVLAVLVHAAFLVLLVFGVNWQSRAPAPVQAELWSKLPPIQQAKPAPEPEPPKPEPPKPEPAKPPPEPVKEPPQPSKADIELKSKLEKERKKQEEKQRLQEEKSRKDKAGKERREKLEAEKRKEDEAKKLAQQKADAAARKLADEKARAEASQKQSAIDDWANRIRILVRNKANIPDSVTGMPEVQIRIRLLVTGAVFDAQIVKLSGNRVYDEAVERAIAGIHSWPVPNDPALFRDNREVTLNIKHEK